MGDARGHDRDRGNVPGGIVPWPLLCVLWFPPKLNLLPTSCECSRKITQPEGWGDSPRISQFKAVVRKRSNCWQGSVLLIADGQGSVFSTKVSEQDQPIWWGAVAVWVGQLRPFVNFRN